MAFVRAASNSGWDWPSFRSDSKALEKLAMRPGFFLRKRVLNISMAGDVFPMVYWDHG